MRFDNPIHDHGFNFPDIADFPDVRHEQRYQDDKASNRIIEEIETRQYQHMIPLVDQLIEHSEKQMPIQGDMERGFIQKWRKLLTKTLNFYQTFHASFMPAKANEILPNKIFESLFERGWWAGTCNADKSLAELLKPEIDQLLEKPDGTPDVGSYDRAIPNCSKDKNKQAQVLSILNTHLRKMGVLAAATKYNKTGKLLVRKATLHVSKPTDKHLFQTYQDCKTISKTTNLHMDPKESLIKGSLYLTPVEEDDGPIYYIDTSNRWMYNELDSIFGRAISVGCYCYNPISRRSVFRLPSRFRKSYLFGRNILDGTPEQKMLLDKAKRITNKKYGNFSIFDPGNTMHTGGWPKKGHRVNLQIQIRM